MAEFVNATSDNRTKNNVLRHEYRVLSDAEKANMKHVKDVGVMLIEAINNCPDSEDKKDAIKYIRLGTMLAVASITA